MLQPQFFKNRLFALKSVIMLAKHYVHTLKEIVLINCNPINERREEVKVAKIVFSLLYN